MRDTEKWQKRTRKDAEERLLHSYQDDFPNTGAFVQMDGGNARIETNEILQFAIDRRRRAV